MELLDNINAQLKEAMKSKDETALNALRAIKSGLNYKKAEKGEDVTEDDVMAVVKKEAKKRKDSIDQFKSGNRDDLAAVEEAQLKIIEQFLPAEMGDDELEAKVKAKIEELGASSKKEMGKVMGAVMKDLQGKVDGKRVKEMVGKLLD